VRADEPPAPASREDRLDDVIGSYLEAVDRGESPDPREILDRHPDLRAELADFFESQRCIDRFAGPLRPVGLVLSGSGAHRFGRYEIIEEIARGGMGVVFKARDPELDRTVAIKLILAGALATREEIDRFRLESKAAAGLDHPHIVPIHETGEIDGQAYYTMRYLEGGNLSRSRERFRKDFREAARLLETVARAVHHAHLKGILHRDLKPANILLDGDGTPYVTDFGLSKALQSERSLTRSGALVGTPTYMAPELASGRKVRLAPAADVYSLGVILYELITGRPPFRGGSSLETLRAVQEREPPPPRSLEPRVPRDLDTICLKCLEKEPGSRYETAAALADDLGRFLAGVPIEARRSSTLGRVWRWSKRRPGVAALIAVVALLLVAISAGSVLASLRLRERLRTSLIAQARADRLGGKAGRRAKGIEALAEAARIRPDLEARNEAVACLALADLRFSRSLGGQAGKAIRDSALDAGFRRCAFADREGTVEVRRIEGGAMEAVLPGGGKVVHLDFSPDGRFLGALHEEGGSCVFRLWDLEHPDAALAEVRPAGDRRSFCFSPAGDRAAAGMEDGSIAIIGLPSGLEVGRLPAAEGMAPVTGIAFDPGGTLLAVGSFDRDRILIRDAASGNSIREVGEATDVFAWHPGGAILAIVSKSPFRSIILWSVDSGRRLGELEGHQASVTDLAFGLDGRRLASTSWDGTFRVWDTDARRELLSGTGNNRCRFRRDGHLLAVLNKSSEIGLWEIEPGLELRTLFDGRLAQGASSAFSAAFTTDGDRLAAAGSGVGFWDLATGAMAAHLPIGETYSVLFEGGGGSLISFGERGLHRWPIERAGEAGGDRVLRIGPPSALGPRAESWGATAQVSLDGSTLALVRSFPGKEIDLLDTRTGGRRILTLVDARFVSLSPDGRWIAAGTWHGTGVRIWEAASGNHLLDLSVEGNANVAFGPDSLSLLTGGSQEFISWEAGSWKVRWRIPRSNPGDMPGFAAFSPGGEMIALTHTIWDVRLVASSTGEELATLAAPAREMVSGLAFSPAADLLAISTEAKAVQLWDLGLLRGKLRELGLDWGTLPVPPAQVPVPTERAAKADAKFRLEVRLGDLGPPGEDRSTGEGGGAAPR
jgi:serine/threonine protein kinase/WD40 repeat protein